MLKYRSLKFFSDAWIAFLHAMSYAADAVYSLEQKALATANRLDQKAINAARKVHAAEVEAQRQIILKAGEAIDAAHTFLDGVFDYHA